MPLTYIQAKKTLGFKENDQPTEKEIKAAYRKKALLTHPDKTIYPANATEEQRKLLLEKRTKDFQLVSEAYQTLNQSKPSIPRRSAQPSEEKEFTFEDAIALFNSLSRNEKIGVVIVGTAATLLYSAYQYYTEPRSEPIINAKREASPSSHSAKRRR
jgi:hypothetical protein